MRLFQVVLFVLCSGFLHAQSTLQKEQLSVSLTGITKLPVSDSVTPKIVYLRDITLVGSNSRSDIQLMPEIVGTNIYAGKKTALVVLENVKGNLVTNTMRQVLAKVAGIQVWESDGSGIQVGIAARGLSPNRSWEFNVRQNGYDIVADPFGYPEAYYNPQMQAVQRIEIVRGQASLQYGPQFGGMVNYILKNGSEIKKPFQVEAQETVGSNGLFNSYTAVGGETKKFHYYGYFDHRKADGWRNNSQYYTNAGFGTFTYRFSEKLSVTGELMHSHIQSQQPGGLPDSLVKEDAKQSFRSRNWFDIKWTTAAAIINYQFNKLKNSRINVKLYGVFANRGSIGNVTPITLPDSINPATNNYNKRLLEVDKYKNLGFEARFLTDYSLGKMKNVFSAGIRRYHGNIDRSRNGIGDEGTRFNENFTTKNQELDLHTHNTAFFAESIFKLSDRASVIPGIRYEHINMTATGRITLNANGTENFIIPDSRTRNFILTGIGSEYKLTEKTRMYFNYSQAYRPILFYDISPNPAIEIVDPNLTDSKGYNIDFGYRGKIKDLVVFDVSVYKLKYNDRIGAVTQQRLDGTFYNYRTNVGNSTAKGLEAMAEVNVSKLISGKTSKVDVTFFSTLGWSDCRYDNFKVVIKENNQLAEQNFKNHKVENAPDVILRSGITAAYRKATLTYQFSYVSKSFGDANNTVFDPTAAVGIIPAYAVSDVHATYKLNQMINIKAGVNNLFDARYFTRRAPSYPGPGAMPSDGRSVYISLAGKF